MPHRLLCDGASVDAPDEPRLRDALREKKILWLDVRDPDETDAAMLHRVFGFHPLALEDAVRARQRTKIERYEDHYFVVFYAAGFIPTSIELELHPLHLFIGPSYLVTLHPGALPPVDETFRRCAAPGAPYGASVGGLVHTLLDAVVDDYFPITDAIADRIEEVEDTIFEHDRAQVTPAIFTLKKALLEFRRVLAPSREVLNVLLRRELPVLEPETMAYVQDLYDHTVRLTENVDLYREFLSSALESQLTFQSNRLNEIVKVLTVTSIVLMANALVAGIYGMNFHAMPELSWRYGYPFALGLMALVTVGLVAYFKRRRWI